MTFTDIFSAYLNLDFQVSLEYLQIKKFSYLMIKIVSSPYSTIPHRYILLQTEYSRLGIVIGFNTKHECLYYTNERSEPSLFRVDINGKISINYNASNEYNY